MNKDQHYIDARGEVLPTAHDSSELLRPLNNLEDGSEIEPAILENGLIEPNVPEVPEYTYISKP